MTNNKLTILVVGPPNSGKSTSLRNLKNRSSWVYLNTDNKDLPIAGANAFLKNVTVDNPLNMLSYIPQLSESPKVEGVVLDTITYLMNQYERKLVATAKDTQKAWGSYATFYGNLMELMKHSTKPFVIMAHEKKILNESLMQYESEIPVKGSVGKLGVSADFTIVVTAKQMLVTKLAEYANPLLTITDAERKKGIKYVFQTGINADSLGELTRAPLGMFSDDEMYIDNDIQLVIDRAIKFYS